MAVVSIQRRGGKVTLASRNPCCGLVTSSLDDKGMRDVSVSRGMHTHRKIACHSLISILTSLWGVSVQLDIIHSIPCSGHHDRQLSAQYTVPTDTSLGNFSQQVLAQTQVSDSAGQRPYLRTHK